MTQRKIALSIEEAADYTGIGRNTLRQLVEWKKLPVLKVGQVQVPLFRVFRSDLRHVVAYQQEGVFREVTGIEPLLVCTE